MDKEITKNITIDGKEYKVVIVNPHVTKGARDKKILLCEVIFYKVGIFKKRVFSYDVYLDDNPYAPDSYARCVMIASEKFIQYLKYEEKKDQDKNDAMRNLEAWDGIIKTDGKEGTQDGDSD